MPLDFPSSPTNGQVYEQYVYDSALPGWRSKGGAVAATYTSDTAPSGAVKGDMWYRTSDGTTYVYVVDANTSQWVEIRSEISTAQVGLVPVVPTSVAVSSGTASVAANGTVSFTTATGISLNNIFTSAYTNYKVIFRTTLVGVTAGWNTFRLRSGGTDATALSYQSLFISVNQAGGPNREYLANDSYWKCFPSGDTVGNNTMEIYQPALPLFTDFWGNHVRSDTGGNESGEAGGVHRVNTAYDGFTISTRDGGSLTGTIKVYGYN